MSSMNRVDELTMKLAEGDLGDAEARELERLLQDPAARAAHLALLEVVARLRGASPAPGLRDRTLSVIEEKITGEIKKQVLGEIRRRGPRRAPAPRPSRAWLGWISIAAAAVVAVAVPFLLRSDPPPPVPHEARISKPVEPPLPAPEPPRPIPPPPVEAPVPRVETPAPVPPPPPPKPPPEPPKKPEPAERPEAPPEPAEKPKPPPPAEPPKSAVVVAQIVQSRGAVKPSKAVSLLSGDGLSLESADALVVLKFPDETKLTLRGPSSLRLVSEGDAGKRVDLAEGYLLAEVARQPEARPFVVTTPHAETRVLGTTLKILADPDPKVGTRVEVLEGKVRVRRAGDGRTIDLCGGQQAQVLAGQALAARPRTGLVGHWKLDETAGLAAADSSGELHPGKLQGGSWAAGRVGGAAKIGPGGFVSVPGFRLPEKFTVAFWVFQQTLNTEQDWFLSFGSNDFHLIREGNMERRSVRTGFDRPTQEFLNVAAAVTANQWTHLAATFDGSELRLFENGSSAGSRKIAVPHPMSDGASFGRMSAASEGLIDDVRVYDHALPLAEIRAVLSGARR